MEINKGKDLRYSEEIGICIEEVAELDLLDTIKDEKYIKIVKSY